MAITGVFSGTFSTNGDATVRLNGKEVAAYRAPEPVRPLFTVPLRNRPLNNSVLADPKMKVARARKHLQELDASVQAYFASNPFNFYEARNPETGDDVLHVVVSSPLPREASTMAGDAIQNLRSALDIMVCDLIRANNATPTHNSGFPSSNEPSKARPKIQGASAATEKFVLRLKGTKRWNDPLRLLQRLDNLHKHNRLMAVGAASVGVLARVHMPGISMTPEGGIMFFGGPGGTPCMQQPGIPTHSGQVFLREGDNELYRLVPHFDEDVRADIGVVFGAGEIGAGQGVRETIFQLANLVERILIVCERRVI